MSEIEELIEEIRKQLPELKFIQLTNFGEKPFESGVWKIWIDGNDSVFIKIEVQNGMIFALYASKTFENKYPITVNEDRKIF